MFAGSRGGRHKVPPAPILFGGVGTDSSLTLMSTAGTGKTDVIYFKTGSQLERVRIDTNGVVIVGGVPSITTDFAQQVQIHGIGQTDTSLGLIRWSSTSGGGPNLVFGKSRGGAKGVNAAVQSTDQLGVIAFTGADGTGWDDAAYVIGYVDGAVSTGNVPGGLKFFTGANANPLERVRIDSSGFVTTGGTSNVTVHSSNVNFEVNEANGNWDIGSISWNTGPNFGVGGWIQGSSRGASIGTQGLVNSGDSSLWLAGWASDGTAFREAQRIQGAIDGTAAANSMPGRLVFATTASGAVASVERLRIDSNGQSIFNQVGSFVPTGNVNGVVRSISYATNYGYSFSAEEYSADTLPAAIQLFKSRATTIGSLGILSNNDNVGTIDFITTEGSFTAYGARVLASIDGTVTSGHRPPARLSLFTCDGTNPAAERLRVDSSGNIWGYGTNPGTPPSGVQFFLTAGSNLGAGFLGGAYAFIDATSTSATGSGYYMGTHAYGGTGGGGWGERYYGFFARNIRGTEQAVASTDLLGGIAFKGYDGATYRFAGSIDFTVDGTVGSGFVPGRIQIFTANSSGTNTERIRIDSANHTVFQPATAAFAAPGTEIIQIVGDNTASNPYIGLYGWGSGNLQPGFNFYVTDGTSPTTQTAVPNSFLLCRMRFKGSDGAAYQSGAFFDVFTDAAFAANSAPTRFQLATTASGSTSPTERFRIDNAGAIYLESIATTTSAANAFINNASTPVVNSVLRSTSSVRYKRNITAVPQERLDAIANLQPIEFNSISTADDPNGRFVGYSAEDVAKIDPTLVHWGYDESDFEDADEHGSRYVKKDAQLKPDGVQYDRVLLLQLAALAQRVAALEGKVK